MTDVTLPTYDDHLLPRNSSALERVLAAAGARMTRLPVDIDLLKRPAEVPSAFLPHLAFELSVDIWASNWNETTKRTATARAIPLQMKKGTAYCLREYARYTDCSVLKIERPPSKIFSGKTLTKDEREAWLATLPQVRVWLHRDAINSPRHKTFIGSAKTGHLRSNRFCLRWTAPTPSTALKRLGRKARWIVSGVETDVRVTQEGTIFLLHVPSLARKSVFCNRVVHKGKFFAPTTAPKRLYRVTPKRGLPWRSPLTPAKNAVVSEPERIKVSGLRRHSVFCNTSLGGYFAPSTAPERIYDRFPIYEAGLARLRNAVQFMGTGRFGIPLHTAQVTISIPSKTNPRRAGTGIIGRKTRFWMPHDPTRVREARLAIQASKRLSDRILLRMGPRPAFVAGSTPVLAAIDQVIVGRPNF